MTAEEIITRLEELFNEPTSPIEFARRSADTFNAWAEENPMELERLTKEHEVWGREYSRRIQERLKDVPWETIWRRTTQDPPPPPESK